MKIYCMTPKWKRSDRQNGFSLVELLFAIALMSMLAISVTATMVGLRKSYTTQAVSADAQQAVRVGMDYMIREIRMAGLDPSGMADAGVVDAGSNSFQFTRDMIDPDTGDVNGAIDNDFMERVTFFYDANDSTLKETLYQGSSGSPKPQSTQTLVENVSRLRFRYLNSDANETSVLGNIRMIELSLSVEEPAGSAGMLERSFTTTIICRNLYL